MIELFLKAIDRLIDLVKLRDKRLKARYDEILKPSFADLLVVHTDYLAMFASVAEVLHERDATLSPIERWKTATDMLAKLRIALSPVRAKLKELYDVPYDEENEADFLLSEERAFLRSLYAYFRASQVTVNRMHKTAATELLDWLNDYKDSHRQLDAAALDAAHDYCTWMIARSEHSWLDVASTFNKLQFEVTKHAS